ncbi:MAG: hypothetical protein KKA31_00805 [Candidatus Margulisbacteria bacterium]|nr:hypothetical protein [Candidatus Margulisiibacteriota bacterium]
MAEEKENKLDIILDEMRTKFKQVLGKIGSLETGQEELKTGQKKLKQEIRTVYTSLKNEIKITALAVKDELKDDIKQASEKLDKHVRELHPV